MKTGFISSKSSLNHDTGDGHPENRYRIQSILERLKKRNFPNLVWSEPGKFDESYLNKTHNSFLTTLLITESSPSSNSLP